MPRKVLFLIIALLPSAALPAEGLDSYLPAKSALKAAKLLAQIDDASASISSRRNSARAAQLKAEAEALGAYALIAASQAGQTTWATSDGSSTAVAAPAAFTAARSRAKSALAILASGMKAANADDGLAGTTDLLSSRMESARSLSSVILASGIGLRAANGLEVLLLSKSRGRLSVFPEAAETLALLRKTSGAGARLAAAFAAHRSGEDFAFAMIGAKNEILDVAPASADSLGRLEAALAAYRAWTAASALAAYPGDLGVSSSDERATLAEGLKAVAALPFSRAEALLASMAEGDARDSAAADSARRLALLWNRSSASLRRELVALCGVRDSVAALFAAAALPAASERREPGLKAVDSLSMLAALDGLEIAFVDDESMPSGSRPESALALLERPELAAAARVEPRFANLLAEARRRLDALYVRAADEAASRLEASPSVAKAAANALGSAPKQINVRAIDLRLPPQAAGRWIAFFATATDASGGAVSFPLRADAAAAEYAFAFTKAAGLGAPKAPGSAAASVSLLARYAQVMICAYDPEDSSGVLTIDAVPNGQGPDLMNESDLEYALLGAWKP